MYQTLNLSHAEAQEMVDAARRRAEADKKAIAIAVSDSHGELIAFLRMDGCRLPPVQIAVNKAFTAARECQPSGTVGESSRARPFPMTNFGDPRYTGWAGGVPLIVEGRVVGAVGVSRLDEKTDAELAAYAADLVTRKAGGGRT
jgi:glc operon protein GlcG